VDEHSCSRPASRRNATLVASEATVLLSLDYDRFERFLLAFSESTLRLYKQTVQKFIAQQRQVITRAAGK
jgi:hypothetical protein